LWNCFVVLNLFLWYYFFGKRRLIMLYTRTCFSLMFLLIFFIFSPGREARAVSAPGFVDHGGALGSGFGAGVVVTGPATWNHMTCYKVKEVKESKPYPSDLEFTMSAHDEGYDLENCEIRTAKAQKLCIDVEMIPDLRRTDPTPPAIGAYPPNAWGYLCYRVKCDPKKLAKGFRVRVEDGFYNRSREVTVSSIKEVCLPLLDHEVIGPPVD
jgi:hypothetical protein